MAVVGRDWIVEPATTSAKDKAAADMVREHLAQMDFDPICYHLLDAILKGRSAGEIMWRIDGAQLLPAEVRPRNGLRFTFADDLSLRLLTISQPLYGEPVPDKKFVVHSVGAKDGNPHGLGLGQKLWWPVYFKRQGLAFWLQFLDKFGAPTAVGKYQAGVDVASLEDALRRIAHDAGVALPEGAAVELLEATRSGQGTHEGLVRYMDEQIAAAILGDGGQKGSGGELASAALLRNELRLELVDADADLLSATLRRTLIAWDVELNMPGAKPPHVWRQVKQEEDLKARAERDKTLFDMGFRPTLDYVKETYGGEWEFKEPATTPVVPPVPGKTAPAPEFSEASAPLVPDQAALDAAIEAIPPEALQAIMDQALGQLLNDIQGAGSYEAAIRLVESRYPTLPTQKLEALLAQAMFAAGQWGQASEAN
jgi:phage gp29-like protein